MDTKEKLFFTVDDIRDLATSRSFARGEDYFLSGDVSKIVRTGNFFTGTVNGTRKYKVSLNVNNNELNFKCNCPYDWEGICKHEVAFALQILNNKYVENNVDEKKSISKEKFVKVFEKTKAEKKLNFLKQLLDRNRKVQQQFIEFTKDVAENLDNIVGEKIDVIRNKIHNELSFLDFDSIDEYYEENYYDDYLNGNDLYDNAERMIEEVFVPYMDKAANYIKNINLLDGLRIILGVYEGSQDLPELDGEEYDLFDGDYNSTVMTILRESINNIALEINEIVFSDESVSQIIDLIFERIKIYDTGKNVNEIFYNIEDFEKLFQFLIVNKITAAHLHNQIIENNFENYYAANIILNIAEILKNEPLWIKTAESFSKNDKIIAMKLIEKYKLKQMGKDFIRLAKMAFHKWPDEFDLYLINNLDKEGEKSLYIDALINYVKTKNKIKYYEILQHFLTDNEKVKFVDDFKDSYNRVFYVQLLETEKRFTEILDCARQNTDSYDFDKLVKPILNVYPSECFALITRKNIAALNSTGRNRQTYQSMIKTLCLLKQISSKKEESVIFLKKLYNHKPHLPALKDEMRKAGLVSF